MKKVKAFGAVILFSGSLIAQGAFSGERVLVSEENAESLGINYQQLLEHFKAAGYEVKRGDQFFVGAHEEDDAVDLSTLGGISITVPLDTGAKYGINAPRNLV